MFGRGFFFDRATPLIQPAYPGQQMSKTPQNYDYQNPQPRDTPLAMLRGFRLLCPNCGKGALFAKYLKVADQCANCHEELHHQRADDAPPYFTIFIVGHLVLGGVLSMEQAWRPSPWLQAGIWLPMALILSLVLLPRVKGAFVGLQWALRMHGFAASTPTEPAKPFSET